MAQRAVGLQALTAESTRTELLQTQGRWCHCYRAPPLHVKVPASTSHVTPEGMWSAQNDEIPVPTAADDVLPEAHRRGGHPESVEPSAVDGRAVQSNKERCRVIASSADLHVKGGPSSTSAPGGKRGVWGRRPRSRRLRQPPRTRKGKELDCSPRPWRPSHRRSEAICERCKVSLDAAADGFPQMRVRAPACCGPDRCTAVGENEACVAIRRRE